MKTLIKNGRVVTAVDDYKGDVLIEDERVSVIGANLQMEVDQTIDAAGKLVIPGGIDPHTHMELPFGGTESSDDSVPPNGSSMCVCGSIPPGMTSLPAASIVWSTSIWRLAPMTDTRSFSVST